MNKNTKTAGMVIASFTLFCALFMSYSMGQNTFGLSEDAYENGYVLNLGSEKNKASMSKSMNMKVDSSTSYDGTFDAVTSDGNTISFAYTSMTFSSGWGTFDGKSSLYNTTSICGMTSLYLDFANSTDSLKLAYGWFNSETNTIDYQVSGVTLSQSSSTFNFNDDGPDAFKIYNDKANKNIQINNIVVSYSCSRSVNPYGSADLDNFTYIYSSVSEDYTIQSYNGDSQDVVIPSKIFDGTHSATVTAIEDSAFEYSYSITSVTLPDTLETIGDNAFYFCDSLTSIVIPDSVTSIGDNAFMYCYDLASVTLSDNLESIAEKTFYFCDSLTSIVIPDSVTSIGEGAFMYCYALENVTLSNNLQTIGTNAFYFCDSITSLIIPDSVTSIGEGAFMYCYKLATVVIPTSTTQIANNAFAYGYWGMKAFYKGIELPSTWSTSAFDSNDIIYFYSQTQNADGFHWHYVSNTPTIW